MRLPHPLVSFVNDRELGRLLRGCFLLSRLHTHTALQLAALPCTRRQGLAFRHVRYLHACSATLSPDVHMQVCCWAKPPHTLLRGSLVVAAAARACRNVQQYDCTRLVC